MRRLTALLAALTLAMAALIAAPTAAATDVYTVALTADTGLDSPVFPALGGADLAMIVGDLGYVAGQEGTYCAQVSTGAAGTPVAILPGNHEGLDPTYGGGDGNMAAYTQCLPAPAGVVPLFGGYPSDYVIERDLVTIIAISPNIRTGNTSAVGGTLTYANGTAEQAALIRAVREAKAAGRWVIVAHHEPSYGIAIGQHATQPDNLASPDLAAAEIASGVDLVVTGHDHAYYRSHLLTGGKTVVDRDSDFTAGAGTVFVTVGNGGHKPMVSLAPTSLFPAVAVQTGTLGLSITASALTAVETATTGTTLDRFAITRTDPHQYDGYVTAVYRDVLGRDPEPAGLVWWSGQLAGGMGRGTFALAVATSDEHLQTQVTADYARLLGRDPEPAGLVWWVEHLRAGLTEAQLIAGIVASDEYAQAHR